MPDPLVLRPRRHARDAQDRELAQHRVEQAGVQAVATEAQPVHETALRVGGRREDPQRRQTLKSGAHLRLGVLEGKGSDARHGVPQPTGSNRPRALSE